MPIIANCENCGQKYRIKDHLVGKAAKCKKCGHPIRIPAIEEATSESTAESGDAIIRHGPRTKGFELAASSESMDHICHHIESHLGQTHSVFHELLSDLVHLDVHWIAPRPDRDFHTLFTTGMSDRPMTVPEGAEEFRYAELLISLPADWPISDQAFQHEEHYWPVRWLKQLARLPHEYDTWLGYGHTVPNGDPPSPFAPNTELCCSMIGPPVLVPDGFSPLEIGPEKAVHFYSVIPIYEEEMEYKLKHGFDALLDSLDEAEVNELLDVRRKNVCKRGFWRFS